MDVERAIGRHLTPEQVAIIEDWATPYLPLLEKYPLFKGSDLVIEGGVGGQGTMGTIARRLFPSAVYVGMELCMRKRRQSEEIDRMTFEDIMTVHKRFPKDFSDAVICANCFDVNLIGDLLRKTNCQVPILVSLDALNALTDRKANPWVKKADADFYTIDQIVGEACPYVAQLHISVGLWENHDDPFYRRYYALEGAAQNAGWKIERPDDALFLLRLS